MPFLATRAARALSRFLAAWLFLPALGLAAPAGAQDVPGLSLTFESLSPADGPRAEARMDRRVARLVALHVAVGEPFSPFLEPGRFRATWSGSLRVSRRDRYTFLFRGRGDFELFVDGESALAGTAVGPGNPAEELISGRSLRLKKGLHSIRAIFTSPSTGTSVLRLSWQSRKFGIEPVSPSLFVHQADPALQHLREGRRLFAVRRCIACHRDPLTATETAMPELAMRAPDFLAIGERLHGAWLAEWIRDPRALRPDARMPKLLHGVTAESDARDLAAWLRGFAGETEVKVRAVEDSASAIRGSILWKELGCFTCHSRTGDEAGFVSLSRVHEKWQPGALADFLEKPREHDAWLRMPDFRLSREEARDLAAFLRRGQKAGQDLAGDAEHGAELAASLACLACHNSPADAYKPTTSAGAPLAALTVFDRACLAAAAETRGRAPDFGFSGEQREQLRDFLKRGRESLARTSAVDFARRQVRERRCNACHQSDGRSAAWISRAQLVADLPDRKLVPGHVEVAQNRPALTFVGEKLQPDYLQQIIAGTTRSPRPWLHARMPSFPRIAEDLAAGLAAQHGFSVESLPLTESGDVAVGKKLAHLRDGFACVMCHAVGAEPPTALFEVRGINLTAVGRRLRPGYYRRWMADPTRLDPASKMPRYASAAGTTALEDFDGDAEKQFQAIWLYLRSLR